MEDPLERDLFGECPMDSPSGARRLSKTIPPLSLSLDSTPAHHGLSTGPFPEAVALSTFTAVETHLLPLYTCIHLQLLPELDLFCNRRH